MPYRFYRSQVFDEDFFMEIYSNASKFAEQFVEEYLKGKSIPENTNVAFYAKAYFLEGFRQAEHVGDLFYIKGFEISDDLETPAGAYFLADISDKTLHVKVALIGKRTKSRHPHVLHVEAWKDLMVFTKDQGCEKFIWHSHPKVRVWKGLQIMGSRLPWKTEYESGHNSQDATMTIYLDEAA